MKRHLRTVLALAIIAVTIGAFVYYLAGHPETVDQLQSMPPATLVLLVALFAGAFIAYGFVTRVSLHMWGKTMSRQENILFNAYSSLVNFFGPGQSGPAFRGVYLKKRHNVGIKQYVLTTLIYFGFYAVISALFLLAGTRPWWQTLLVMLAVASVSFGVIRWYKNRSKLGKAEGLNIINLGWLGLATGLQLLLQIAVYGVALHSVGADVSWAQVVTYTGVANFALFVSLTPNGIGIREAFLLFTQDLHHIDSSTIVAASVVDRAAYLLFLGLLFVLVISLHAKDKLRVNQLMSEGGKSDETAT